MLIALLILLFLNLLLILGDLIFILIFAYFHLSFRFFLTWLVVVDGLVVLPLIGCLKEVTDLFFALLVVHLLVIGITVIEVLLLIFGAVNCLFSVAADPFVSVPVAGLLDLFLHLLVHIHTV